MCAISRDIMLRLQRYATAALPPRRSTTFEFMGFRGKAEKEMICKRLAKACRVSEDALSDP